MSTIYVCTSDGTVYRLNGATDVGIEITTLNGPCKFRAKCDNWERLKGVYKKILSTEEFLDLLDLNLERETISPEQYDEIQNELNNEPEEIPFTDENENNVNDDEEWLTPF